MIIDEAGSAEKNKIPYLLY